MFSENEQNFIVFQADCPDRKCRQILYFSCIQTHVDCLRCGQRHSRASLQDVQAPSEFEGAIKLWLRDILLANLLPKRGPEMVKVLGLSNYYCKLLSPLLTRYGMDKFTGRAKLLSDMNQGEMFDCGLFGDRAFLIDQEHLSLPGYGRDGTGSMSYLSETLELINSFNEGEERLIPIHADGDGHCLVHAVSRALVGRELFWHPLRCCLKRHFIDNIHAYKELFKDFVDERDWEAIVDECDPDFRPPDGELHGLRTIHIFGLANVLKRPIILLDSLECMKKLGDYAALFLPGLVSPSDCRGKDNSLNKPICIAWSSHSHTHYIPLIGVKKRPLPVLPHELIPKVWGMPQTQIYVYIEFDVHGTCTIAGNRLLSECYIYRLVSAMESLFFDQNNIHPSIVSDAQLYLYPNHGIPGTRFSSLVNKVKQAVQESRLYRCLSCNALCELLMEHNWLKAGGVLYNTALTNHKRLVHNTTYYFPLHGIHCKYDCFKDELIPDPERTGLKKCTWCQDSVLYKVKSDGTVLNKNDVIIEDDDMEIGPEDYSSQFTEVCETFEACNTQQVNLNILWNNKIAKDVVKLNLSKKGPVTDTVYQIASEFMQKHFPRDSSNQRLQCMISEQILKQIKQPVLVPSHDISSSSKVTITETIVNNKKAIPLHASSKTKNEINTVAKLEFVKVVTSDGRQANLTLAEAGVVYSDLQSWVEEQFQIPPENQKIKYGFPPKEFNPPDAKQILDVQHGDRIIVEICKAKEKIPVEIAVEVEKKESDSSESLPTISSKAEMSTIMNKIVNSELQWSLAKMSPSLFKKHGRIYTQITERFGKNDKKHTLLETFPTKVFCYNSENDSIELCVKPYGHFPIFYDTDYLIQETKNGTKIEGVGNCPLMNSKLSNLIPTNQTQTKTTKSSALSDIENVQNTSPAPLVRKGPGFSIINSKKTGLKE